jgi:hypothetical protein
LLTFAEDYQRGLESLFTSASAFARFARALGAPSENYAISTAQVSFDPEAELIHFEINPDFLSPLTDGEIAAVIAHETYHVLLGHFDDFAMKNVYTDEMSLIQAQECIINDSLFNNIGFDLPPGMYSGPKKFGQDFSWFTTKEGYDFIVKTKNFDSKDQNIDDKSDDGSSESSSAKSSNNSDNSIDSEKTNDSNGSQSESGEKSNTTESNEIEQINDESSNSEISDNSEMSSIENLDSESDLDEDETLDNGDGRCGGIVVSDENMQHFKDAISKAINGAIKNTSASDVPDDVSDMIENVSHIEGIDVETNGWSVSDFDKDGGFSENGSVLELNWESLLARINPKIKSSGKPQMRDSWHQPRRRMLNSYPEIILPTTVRVDKSEGKGDSVPTLILALDMSVSIPTYLIQKLASLADSIPSDVIKPISVTWSDTVETFDTKLRRIVRRRGTNIDAVYLYAEEIERTTGAKPYVLVITDGVCSFNNPYFRRSMGKKVDTEKTKARWYWMGIDDKSFKTIKRNFSDHLTESSVYNIKNFM